MELPPVFHSLHPPPLNPVISPKEHFFRHIQHDLRAPALPNIISPRPPSLTALPLLPQRSAVSLFWAPNPFFGGAAPTVVRPLYTLAGTRQLQRGGRPHRGSLVGSSSGAYHRLRKKARLSATMSHNVHRLSTFRWGQKPPKRILGSSRSFSFYQFSFWENFYWDSCPLHILSLAI